MASGQNCFHVPEKSSLCMVHTSLDTESTVHNVKQPRYHHVLLILQLSAGGGSY